MMGLAFIGGNSTACYQFRSPELAIRPLRWPGLTRHIYLVRRRDRSLSVAAQGFYEWAMAHRPQAPAPASRKTPRRRTER